MKNYVLATHNFGDHMVYYFTDFENGKYSYSTVNEAMRFDYTEILEFLRDHENMNYLGFSVVRIEDVTFELFKTNKDLVRKFSELEYAIR